MTIFDILKFEIIFFYVFFQVIFFKGEIENYSLNLRPMLPIKSCYSKSKFSDDVLQNLFSLLPSKVRFDQRIEGARCARAELHPENLTGFMLAPEVMQLADFGFCQMTVLSRPSDHTMCNF